MNPNQQLPPQAPSGPQQPYQNPSPNNPYEFILNPAKPPRMHKLGPGNNNFAFTIGIIVGGCFILMLVVALVINVFAPKTLTKADLLSLAQTQQEMIRISNEARLSSVQQATKNLAVTAQFTMISEQETTLAKLGQLGVKKIKEKDLGLKQSAVTDQKLTTARDSSNFDRVYTEIAQEQFNSYAQLMKTLYARSGNPTERDQFSSYYTDMQLLLGQIPYTQAVLDAADQTQ